MPPLDLTGLFKALELSGKSSLPRSGRLHAGLPEHFATPEDTVARLTRFRGLDLAGEGWVCCAGRVAAVMAGEAVPQDAGPVLSAEFFHPGLDRSFHLRQSPDGWRGVEITRCMEDGDASSDGAWIIRHRFLRRGSAGALLYEVGWTRPEATTPLDSVRAFRPEISRFVGFSL